MAEDNCRKTTVAMLLSLFDYTCGSHITPPSHSLHGVVVVMMEINCSSPIEAPFYSSAWDEGTFTRYCGADGAERDVKLKQSFKTVFPICAGCSRDGYVKAVNRSWNISGERVLRPGLFNLNHLI